jgi:hypothetical protein
MPELKDMIHRAINESIVIPTTTPIPNPGTQTVRTSTPTPQQGWQCPVCGAVMSPWTSVCVRCNGFGGYNPTWKFNPYEVTCTTKTNT